MVTYKYINQLKWSKVPKIRSKKFVTVTQLNCHQLWYALVVITWTNSELTWNTPNKTTCFENPEMFSRLVYVCVLLSCHVHVSE